MEIASQTTPHQKRHLPAILLPIVVSVISAAVTIIMVVLLFCSSGMAGLGASNASNSYDIMNRFDAFITNSISSALQDFITIPKEYLLSDNNLIAPEPDQSNFGSTDDPSSMQWIFNKAHILLDGQETLFTPETEILEGSEVQYYFDDSIFCVTWKQPMDNAVYTISEIKIAHASQFRRFLANGEFGSEKQYLTSEMASSVNAVVASAGDFYKYRQLGLLVYNGKTERFIGQLLDTCFIDDKGDLIFSRRGQLKNLEETQRFVEDNNIRFSLCFGPILIEDGKRCEPYSYVLGEIDGRFARAALCQMDELHYLLVTVNIEDKYRTFPTLFEVARRLEEMGCQKAYTLDGGQTATIVMNDQVINEVSHGSQRYISDIIYFATAIPEGE